MNRGDIQSSGISSREKMTMGHMVQLIAGSMILVGCGAPDSEVANPTTGVGETRATMAAGPHDQTGGLQAARETTDTHESPNDDDSRDEDARGGLDGADANDAASARSAAGQAEPFSDSTAVLDYPPGPYGRAEGAVTRNLSFLADDGSRLDLATMRTVENRRMMVLFTTAAWCARCARYMASINHLHRTYADRGLFMAVSIYEGRTYDPPSAQDLVAYQRSFDVDGVVLGDRDGAAAEFFDGPTRPMVLAFDLETMVILYLHDAWLPDEITALVDARLSPP
ncbi:MAG: hypothetical protein VX589_07775 [Myxococcota bacterium]|nr:hypothetical protein [Myxococcota bacterium]